MNYDIKQADHLLYCSSVIGKHRKEYYMPCAILGTVDSGKIKVVVFGERNLVGREHIKRIKYVYSHRLFKMVGSE